MARTKRAVSPAKRAAPIDVSALRERVKKIEARISYTVPVTVKIDARMYEALVNAAEKYEVRFVDIVRRSIAEGLSHMTEFVSPFDESFETPEYRPGRGMSRNRNALEQLTGQPVTRERMVDDNDPLVAATLNMGMRAGAPRREANPRAAAMAAAMEQDDADNDAIEGEAVNE